MLSNVVTLLKLSKFLTKILFQTRNSLLENFLKALQYVLVKTNQMHDMRISLFHIMSFQIRLCAKVLWPQVKV